MTFAELVPYPQLFNPWFAVAAAILSVLIGLVSVSQHSRPAIPSKAPKLIKGGSWPIIGTFRFFTDRWDFHKDSMAMSPTGNFSYYVGNLPVISVTGDDARKMFFESKALSLTKGYEKLFAGSPSSGKQANGDDINSEQSFVGYFGKRLTALLKRDQFNKGLPYLMSDVRARLDELGSSGVTDPFDSIYRIVFQLTMRTVACNDIAEDPKLLDRVLHLYEMVEKSATPTFIMYPNFPSIASLTRLYGGTQIYMIFSKIVEGRKKTGKRQDDPFQFLIDQGDSVLNIITFVMGALFAGQLNSGINAAWVLVYLANDTYWREKAMAEVRAVAEKYDSDTSKCLADRLASVPLEAWESEIEFPVLALCLRDSIRLQMNGTAFRKNVSGFPIQIGDEIIPPDFYVTYPIADIHHDESVYPDSTKWDPARYTSERQEDKKKPYAWLGWGVARHPCLGMRFAKLEQNIIIAFFLAKFEFDLVDIKGQPTSKLPDINLNENSAQKPKQPARIRYKLKE